MHETYVSLKLALKNLRSNVGRTILSLLGIVIGTAAVVLVMSFGGGVKQFVMDQIESFGSNLIEIEVKVPQTKQASTQNMSGQVGGTQITTLKLSEIEDSADLPNIAGWYAGLMSQQNANYQKYNRQAFLMGVSAGVWDVDDQIKLDQGRYFTDKEDKSNAQVAVIGHKIEDEFFSGQSAVGKTIKIKGQPFKVIGTLKERGSTGFFNFDDIIYLPVQTLQKKIMGVDHVQFAFYKVKDEQQTKATVDALTEFMRKEHETENEKEDDFAVMSIEEAAEMIDKVFSVINILLLALTSISLLVGGVGIMNVMYVAVTERTFEIGLRKALGARKSDILKQFLFESIFITLWGGLIGTTIGLIVSQLAAFFAGRAGFPLSFPITLPIVALGFGFSAAVGLIFGLRPAYKASQLTPMEALVKK